MNLRSRFARLARLAAVAAFTSRATSAQLPDSAIARAVADLSEFSHVCADSAAALWRVSLCGPIVLVEPETRAAIASRKPPSASFVARGAEFVGALPADIGIANTSLDWGGEPWTMVMLPLPEDRFDRVRLLAHESFHRIQARLAVPLANVVISQLEERDARYWLRLELRALAATQLDSGAAKARVALGDALLFRAARHRVFPGIDTLESALELGEGLAEYTGVMVAARVLNASSYRAADWARRNLERLPTFARSYGYGMGPPLGLALDRFAPGWRDHVGSIPSLSVALARAVNWVAPAMLLDSAHARSSVYGGSAIALGEDKRAETRAMQVAAYRARLIDGPVMVFRQRGVGGSFNPNTIFPMGEAGLVYPERTVFADWGTLTVHAGGLLVSPDRSLARVSALGLRVDSVAGTASGDGWELTLARGWVVTRGARTGDYEVRPTSLPNGYR